MSDISLIQSEADALIAMEKRRISNQRWDYPLLGRAIRIPLLSKNKREKFFLDISRGKIDLLKGTYQNRTRQIIVLVRLDFGGAPHQNPDGQDIPPPHLHICKEGYGDKWAVPVPTDILPATKHSWRTLGDFMRYCNICKPPIIERGLFI